MERDKEGRAKSRRVRKYPRRSPALSPDVIDGTAFSRTIVCAFEVFRMALEIFLTWLHALPVLVPKEKTSARERSWKLHEQLETSKYVIMFCHLRVTHCLCRLRSDLTQSLPAWHRETPPSQWAGGLPVCHLKPVVLWCNISFRATGRCSFSWTPDTEPAQSGHPGYQHFCLSHFLKLRSEFSIFLLLFKCKTEITTAWDVKIEAISTENADNWCVNILTKQVRRGLAFLISYLLNDHLLISSVTHRPVSLLLQCSGCQKCFTQCVLSTVCHSSDFFQLLVTVSCSTTHSALCILEGGSTAW